MKTDFKVRIRFSPPSKSQELSILSQFSNLLGTVYCQGNLLFTPDGTCLLSPVGNRVSVFDLIKYVLMLSLSTCPYHHQDCRTDTISNKSYTLPFSHRRNIARLALNPRGNLLISIDEDGRAILTNFPRRVSLYHFSFKSPVAAPVTALAFSPSGRYFAVGIGGLIEVWHTPLTPDTDTDEGLEFAPFVRHRVYAGHYDSVQSLEWSSDSRFFLSAAKDLTARIWSLNPEDGFIRTTLAGHREGLRGAWFSSDQEKVTTGL